MMKRSVVGFGLALLLGTVSAFAQGGAADCERCIALEVDAGNLSPDTMAELSAFNASLLQTNDMDHFDVIVRALDGSEGIAYCMEVRRDRPQVLTDKVLPFFRALKQKIEKHPRALGKFEFVVKNDCR